MPRIAYLIDDDVAVRRALALLFRSVRLDVQTFASAEEFLDLYRPHSPETRRCLVCDIRMPGMSGLELQDELRRRHITLPLILISGHADVPLAVRAMRAGALSVLEKPVDEQDLIDVIHEALNGAGDGAISSSSALEVQRGVLTERQRDVFDLLIRGLQTKDVARQLDLSPRTAECVEFFAVDAPDPQRTGSSLNFVSGRYVSNCLSVLT
jgi:two-component system, LuxR family, response regulator FixJ